MSENRRRWPKNIQNKVGLRLAVVLSIAILPLGMISVYQTHKVLEERRALSEIALLELTQRSVGRARETVSSAIATADALAALSHGLNREDQNCDALLSAVVDGTPILSFAGIVGEDRRLTCASNGATADLSDLDFIQSGFDDLAAKVLMRPVALLGGVRQVNVTVPIVKNGNRSGLIWVSIRLEFLSKLLANYTSDLDLVLFEPGGEIIASEALTYRPELVLPVGLTIADLDRLERHTFRDRNGVGRVRDFAVVPLVEGEVSALGSWDPTSRDLAIGSTDANLALYFPIIMWVVAAVVSYIGVHRLVIRHFYRLAAWMRDYSTGNAELKNAYFDNAPEELEFVAASFRDMASRLDEQEQALESDLKEKTTLLREVHHRVKNNLQIISSIMNMQMRTAQSAEAKRLLKRVQDRIMALSAIHRYLYQSRKQSLVRADQLMEDIVQQLIVVGTLNSAGEKIDFQRDFEPVEINPDQSVPLSLLANEAILNAVKYCGSPTGASGAFIRCSLKKEGVDVVRFTVENSLSPAVQAPEPDGYANQASAGMSGLGSQLIESFVAQLEGEKTVTQGPDSYAIAVRFTLLPVTSDEDEP